MRVRRGKLLVAGVGAVAVVAAIAALRSGAPPAETITGPRGELIRAFHDPTVITPPERPEVSPRPPSELRLDPRSHGTLVSWPPAPFGFEVRWGRAGGQLDNVRYHATSGTTLQGLEPGRYRVEVRSVDGIGQRSAPASAEFDVGDEPPQWQRGLGFTADFGAEPTLDAVRWRLSEDERGCLRREESVLLVEAGCGSALRPASPLTLTEPDADGVRGRLVVITDAPQNDEVGTELTITASSMPTTRMALMRLPGPRGSVQRSEALPRDAIALRVSTEEAAFEVGSAIALPPAPGEYRHPTAGTASPGALHRWELVFTADDVQVLRDGELVTTARITVPWRQALVDVTVGRPEFGGFGGQEAQTPPRIAFLGFTGPAPDPRPVKVLNVQPDGTTVPAAGAVAGRLVAITAFGFGLGLDDAEPVTFDAAAPGRPPVPLTLRPMDPGHPTVLAAELPASLLTGELRLTPRHSPEEFFVPRLVVELTYPQGSAVDVEPLETVSPRPALRPRLQLRSPETNSVLSDGERTRPAKHRAELRIEGAADAASVVPWVAVQVDLNDRRVLTFPTATAGPAFATRYELIIDFGDLPDGVHSLVVTLVPDRPDVPYGQVSQTVRVSG